MSNKRLDALKALLKKQKTNGTGNGRRGDMYPFWNMEIGESATIRFLPDKNLENPFQFFVEKMEHTLSIDGKNERITCLQTFGEKCPICKLSVDFYKAEGKGSENGKYYYRKKSALTKVLVVKDPLPPDEETGEKSEGKVMTTQLNWQLIQKILTEVSDEDFPSDDDFWDFENGINYNIKKSAQGNFGVFNVDSGFARRPSAIDPAIVESIELIDLQTLLPQNPGYEVVKRKLDSHLNGSSGEEGEGEGEEDDTPPSAPVPVKPKTAPKPIAHDGDDDIPFEGSKPVSKPIPPAPVASDDGDVNDILAQIRNRKNAKG
jgi:hypothetical protein